jgi:arylamine N-acetyltransferase
MAYSRAQIGQFLDHIHLPVELHYAEPSPALLNALHIHTLSKLPYENLALHYNPTHTIDLNPQHLFEKIVLSKKGRGGYCMENAILYNHILRGLGFDAYTAGVRTRTRIDGVPQGEFPGW